MKKFVLLGCLFFCWIVPLLAQTIPVTGLVKDGTSNEPLPGVTIQVKGTTTGTSTNADGTYAITVPEGAATLVFSYVGYTVQEVAVNNRTVINVSPQRRSREPAGLRGSLGPVTLRS